jgi:hypothetical protein
MVVKSVFSFQFWFEVAGVVLVCGLPAQIDTLTTLICGDNDFLWIDFLGIEFSWIEFLGLIFRFFLINNIWQI